MFLTQLIINQNNSYINKRMTLPKFQNYNKKIKIGILLIGLSTIMFILIFITPFLPIENKYKIVIGSISLIGGEICFWIGGALIGKELFNKYKSKLSPKNWFKKNKTDNEIIE